jgi:hypothetical protein
MQKTKYSFIYEKQRLEWLEHVWRTDGQIIIQALVAEMRSKKPLGRPRKR